MVQKSGKILKTRGGEILQESVKIIKLGKIHEISEKRGPHFILVEESENSEKCSDKLGKILPQKPVPGGKITFSNYGRRHG